jgi:lysophospholipase L1-like esterase
VNPYWLLRILLAAALALAGCAENSSTPAQCVLAAPQASAQAATIVDHPSATAASNGGDTVFAAGAPVFSADGPAPTFASPPQIVLPSKLYLVTGETYRLQYENVISGIDSSTHIDVTGPPGSESHANFWEYTPAETGSSTLSITVKDRTGATLVAASRPVVVSAAHTGGGLRHLSIGDSITRAGGYVQLAVECMLEGETVGTRTYDTGSLCEEGRGGWTLGRYTTRIGQPQGGDSPFLFPVGVDGDKFVGNTSFWRDVTVGDPGGYDYDGFQMIARGWQAEAPYRFAASGYPASPAAGDVVVDPTLPVEAQWLRYDGTSWSPLNPQPAVEFSFAKYLKRFAAAFSGGTPTSVSIMLGTVDFLSSLTDQSWSEYRARLDTLIESIRAWNPDVPIVLIGAPNGGPADLWANQKVNGADFNRRIIDHGQRLYAVYDTAQQRDRGVYVISFLGAVSGVNMADYVHPKMPEGHEQMAPWLAGVLAHLVGKGAA